MTATSRPDHDIARLFELVRRVNSSTETSAVLEEIARGVVEVLGFGVCAIARLRDDTLVMTTVVGPEDARRQILGRRTSAENILDEYRQADHWGILRYVPHGRMDQERLDAAWLPDFEPAEGPNAWHPEDALYAPLYSPAGELLGNLAVDLPPGGTVPDQELRELLEMLVVQASLALFNAQVRERLTKQVRLGEAMKRLALAGSRETIEDLLDEAAQALVSALEAAQVIVHCFPDTTTGAIASHGGCPDSGPVSVSLLEALRKDLQGHVVAGHTRPQRVDAEPDMHSFPVSARVLGRQMSLRGWKQALVVPMAVDRDLFGCIVAMVCDDVREFSQTEIDTVHEAARELARLVRDHRLRQTERRLLEELREVDRYKGELIATISHELKTPLTSIMGHTELLGDAGVDSRSLNAISRNAQRLNRLVANLLNYSRVQDKLSAARQEVDLVELGRVIVEQHRAQAEVAGIDLEMVDSAGRVPVLGDSEELFLVVENLVGNAVKYTGQGGSVVVTIDERRGQAFVSVRDTGIGISEVDQSHLFSAFHRSSNPDAASIPGTGLGLAISQRIAELHHGRIEVDSTLGAGSTFTLVVPGAVARAS